VELVTLYDGRLISAADVALSLPSRVYTRGNQAGIFLDAALAFPTPQGKWRIVLRALTSELITSAGIVKMGALLRLVMLDETGFGGEIAAGVQSAAARVGFVGELPLDYGFGVFLVSASLDAGDYLTTRAIWERRSA